MTIFGISWTDIAWGVGIFLVSAALTLGIVTYFVVQLPPNYFQAAFTPKPAGNWRSRFGKTIVGAILVIAGAIMAIPGVPGQGIVTMLVGIMLLEFPGKRRMEFRLVRLPTILRGLNFLRARFKKPPLDLDPEIRATPEPTK